jgi:primosomal replication protein N
MNLVPTLPQFEFVNEVFLSGTVAGVPDVRWTTAGMAVVKFYIRTRRGKNSQSHACVSFDGELATKCGALKSGSFVELKGYLLNRSSHGTEVVVQGLRVLAEQTALPLTPGYGRDDTQ